MYYKLEVKSLLLAIDDVLEAAVTIRQTISKNNITDNNKLKAPNTPFGWPTPGRPIGRPGVGRPMGVS